MRHYPYRSELKAPGRWSSVDFSDPRMAPGVALLTAELRQEVLALRPPAGVRLTVQKIPSFDGEEISCFCLEPEKGAVFGMLYCHGGGFFLPVQPMMVKLAAQYAQQLKLRVYLPEYRILPEHPNPYPFRDCLSVLHRMKADGIRDYLLYGESAGGTLAAGLALWERDHGDGHARGQCLVYPALDDRCGRYTSMRFYSEAAWPLKNALVMWRQYLKNGTDGLDPYLIPMRTEDVSGLPDTYIEPQEIDTLRDEAIAYAERLKAAGVAVTLQVVEGSYHGFDADTENPFVRSVIRQRIEGMRHMLQNTQERKELP